MKSCLSLVSFSTCVHKRQSLVAHICIVLAVSLVTSIFSMAEMRIRAEKEKIPVKYGNYHNIWQDVPEDEAEQIRKHTDVAAFSWYDKVNADADQYNYINGKSAALYGIEKTYIGDIRNYETGHFDYTVSGVYEDDKEFNHLMDGGCVYMDNVAFHEILSLNSDGTMSRYYIQFKKDVSVKTKHGYRRTGSEN